MIHKFELDGTRVVLDVNSGSVHVVDELIWDLLEHYHHGREQATELLSDKYATAEVVEAYAELEELVGAGKLFAQDYSLVAYKLPQPVVKSLCLHIAHDCNLRCQYCFAATGDFGLGRKLMDYETGRKAIDFLIEASGARKHIEIDFFGGEPLLNFEVVKRLVEYGEELALQHNKVFKFTLTTNAVLLDDEITNWLNEKEISVVLSLDGRAEVNDKMRTYVDGSGTYEDIVPSIRKLVLGRQGQNYYVRGTFTHHNLDFARDVLHMVDLGFDIVSVEPVVAPATADYAFKAEDLPVVAQEYEVLAREYLKREQEGRGFNFFHFNLDLSGGPCLPKRLSGCGAGHEYLAVSPEGDFYPCHQFVGREEFRIGSVEQGVVNRELMHKFQEAHIYNKRACNNCWAKFYCSGGCHANAEAHSGSLLEPYALGCEMQKKRIECAIYIQLRKAGLI